MGRDEWRVASGELPAPLPLAAPATLQLRQHIQHFPHGPVADGVDGDGKTGILCIDGQLPQCLRRGDGDARVVRIAGEGFQHVGGARPHRAVGKCFDVAHPQPVVAKTGLQAQARQLLADVRRRCSCGRAIGDGRLAVQLLKQPKTLVAFIFHPLIVDAGQPQPVGFGDGFGHPVGQCRFVWFGDVAAYQFDGVPFAQNAVGLRRSHPAQFCFLADRAFQR